MTDRRVAEVVRVVERERQTVGVVLTLSGIQDTAVVPHHADTEHAVVSIRIGKALIYLHDPQAAAAFARTWRRHLRDAAKLPRERIQRPSAAPKGSTRAAVVLDARGTPPVSSRLVQPPGNDSYLRIQLGSVIFDVRDLGAFASTHAAIRQAEVLSASVLRRRATPVPRRGQAFEQVAQALPTARSNKRTGTNTVRASAAAPARPVQPTPKPGQRWMQ